MGWTIRKIASATHICHHHILDVIAAHRQDRELLHIKLRPQKVTPEISERVVSITMDDGSLSNPNLAQILQSETGATLSAESIRTTRRRYQFKFGKPKKCHCLAVEHILARMQFARDFEGDLFQKYRHFPFVFSDECRFAYRNDNHFVWKRVGQYSYSTMNPVNKFPKFSITVLGPSGRA
jgi:transposase